MYSLISVIAWLPARAMPAAKALTIGDNPKVADKTAKPKHDVVANASISPSAWGNALAVILKSLGKMITATTSIASQIAIDLAVTTRNLLSVSFSSPRITDVTTDSTANAKTSSNIAALIMILASLVHCIVSSAKVRTVIAMLVAESVAPTSIAVVAVLLFLLFRARGGMLGMILGAVAVIILIYWFRELKSLFREEEAYPKGKAEFFYDLFDEGETLIFVAKVPGPAEEVEAKLGRGFLEIRGGGNFVRRVKVSKGVKLQTKSYTDGVLHIKLQKTKPFSKGVLLKLRKPD